MAYNPKTDTGVASYNAYTQLTKAQKDALVGSEPLTGLFGEKDGDGNITLDKMAYEDLRYAQLVHIVGGGLTLDTSGMDLQVDTDALETKVDQSNTTLGEIVAVLESSILVRDTYQCVVYSDASFKYICHAPAGVPRADSKWRVQKTVELTGERLLTETNLFDQPATDLATVAAITFFN